MSTDHVHLGSDPSAPTRPPSLVGAVASYVTGLMWMMGRTALGVPPPVDGTRRRTETTTDPTEDAGSLVELVQEWAIDHGMYVDRVLRQGVRTLLHNRIHDLQEQYGNGNVQEYVAAKHAFAHALRQSPTVAQHADKANQQHYQVDSDFFRQCLGPHLKYSCCLYPRDSVSLDQAEVAMLDLYCDRAQLVDGLSILDLGCGWGSLSLYLAQKYPLSHITGMSNSRTQKEYIDRQAHKLGITNLRIITADINSWTTSETYDRVMSIEMFEHLKNYGVIMSLINSLLRPGGKCFIHTFVHKDKPYHFETGESQSWMARYFFTGGTMPSFDLFPMYFHDHLTLECAWAVNGIHYAKTARHWLNNLDQRRDQCMTALIRCYGADQAHVWWNRWRVFFIAVEELFSFNQGNEWFVGHYLLSKKG